ncbi:hypothetical protein PPYR_00075 [Photinus pyralis]|uniref:DDE Tnp4 domain-containing protein n=1 Tax=Photinus pyralis TaxID=7054 RepID=A0A5N4B0I9_PHOPY|nr:hypothetical protein PPYR_00075 [Photinus pyralis]
MPTVDVEKKVLLTIWLLAKLETFLACGDRFGVSRSSAHYIFKQIVVILSSLVDEYIIWPNQRQCEETARIFEERSGIPNVIGAIDGTHIFIKQPVGNSIDYYNRYQCHSVVLQVVCNANKKL